MPRRNLSGYRIMWLFVMFDLPVTTRKARRRYTKFRKGLLKLGFAMLQFSVYARSFPSEEACQSYRRQVQAELPPDGQVRVISVTDRQFGKMQVFTGRRRLSAEKSPDQLLLL